MAKIFSLPFQFSNQEHIALVSAANEAGEPYIHIQFTSVLISDMLESEHIRYKGTKGYKRLHIYQDPYCKKLVANLAKAIENELSDKLAIIRRLTPSFEKVWHTF